MTSMHSILIAVEVSLVARVGLQKKRFFFASSALKRLASFLWVFHLLKAASDVNAGRRSSDIQKTYFFKNAFISPVKVG